MPVQAMSKQGWHVTRTYWKLLSSLCAIIEAILVHTKTACLARELPPLQS